MVDRQLVTNHFLQFIMMDRADPKKFQVLQLIAALLSWSDGKYFLHSSLFKIWTNAVNSQNKKNKPDLPVQVRPHH